MEYQTGTLNMFSNRKIKEILGITIRFYNINLSSIYKKGDIEPFRSWGEKGGNFDVFEVIELHSLACKLVFNI